MTRLFEFQASDYAAYYKTHGFAHISSGLTEEFHSLLVRQVEEYLKQSRLEAFALGGKQQSLYEFPQEGDCYEQFLDMVAAVTGLDREKLVLSERHIKAYESTAEPYPAAHKDRFASEVSVGFAVRVPEVSRLVLYPYQERDVNPFNSWAELREGLPEAQKSERVLPGAQRVELADCARDVVLFRGHSIWHMRENPAGAMMVYLKLNTFNSDPLGEDPSTSAPMRCRNVETCSDEDLRELVPQLARRVDHIARRYNHLWQEVIGVTLSGRPFQVIDQLSLDLLRGLDGRKTISAVLENALPQDARRDGLNRLRDLAARGIIELTDAATAPNAICCNQNQIAPPAERLNPVESTALPVAAL